MTYYTGYALAGPYGQFIAGGAPYQLLTVDGGASYLTLFNNRLDDITLLPSNSGSDYYLIGKLTSVADTPAYDNLVKHVITKNSTPAYTYSVISIDTFDGINIYANGVAYDNANSQEHYAVWKSTDGGVTWPAVPMFIEMAVNVTATTINNPPNTDPPGPAQNFVKIFTPTPTTVIAIGTLTNKIYHLNTASQALYDGALYAWVSTDSGASFSRVALDTDTVMPHGINGGSPADIAATYYLSSPSRNGAVISIVYQKTQGSIVDNGDGLNPGTAIVKHITWNGAFIGPQVVDTVTQAFNPTTCAAGAGTFYVAQISNKDTYNFPSWNPPVDDGLYVYKSTGGAFSGVHLFNTAQLSSFGPQGPFNSATFCVHGPSNVELLWGQYSGNNATHSNVLQSTTTDGGLTWNTVHIIPDANGETFTVFSGNVNADNLDVFGVVTSFFGNSALIWRQIQTINENQVKLNGPTTYSAGDAANCSLRFGGIDYVFQVFHTYPNNNRAGVSFAKSTDGGLSYSPEVEIEGTPNFNSDVGYGVQIYAADPNNIFVVYTRYDDAFNSNFLRFAKSTDGGATWVLSVIDYDGASYAGTWNSLTNYNINDAVVFNNISYIALQPNTNSQPNTHPADWSNSFYANEGWAASIYGADAQHIWVSYFDYNGNFTKIASTSDGGATWTTQNIFNNSGYYCPLVAAGTNMFVLFNNAVSNTLLTSNDCGVTWNSAVLPFNGYSNGIYALTPQHLYIVVQDISTGFIKLYQSTDGGQTWNGGNNIAQTFTSNVSFVDTLIVPNTSDIFVVYGYQQSPHDSRIILAVSHDSGLTWTLGFIAVDGQHVALNYTSAPSMAFSPNLNTFYVPYTFYGNSTGRDVAVSWVDSVPGGYSAPAQLFCAGGGPLGQILGEDFSGGQISGEFYTSGQIAGEGEV